MKGCGIEQTYICFILVLQATSTMGYNFYYGIDRHGGELVFTEASFADRHLGLVGANGSAE